MQLQSVVPYGASVVVADPIRTSAGQGGGSSARAVSRSGNSVPSLNAVTEAVALERLAPLRPGLAERFVRLGVDAGRVADLARDLGQELSGS